LEFVSFLIVIFAAVLVMFNLLIGFALPILALEIVAISIKQKLQQSLLKQVFIVFCFGFFIGFKKDIVLY
jgi:hypothetical protein